jgi:hypothetical protein
MAHIKFVGLLSCTRARGRLGGSKPGWPFRAASTSGSREATPLKALTIFPPMEDRLPVDTGTTPHDPHRSLRRP